MKISVLTPTNRDKEGIDIVARALMRQDFEDFEWIIGSPTEPDAFIDYKWVRDPKKEDGDYWVLNKLYNKMIREAEGELLVSIQDYTSFNPDALSKFWFHYKANPLSVISGVGNKYLSCEFVSQTWQDPREKKNGPSFYEVFFADIEGNFCSIPKEALYDVGGFDESLDKYAGMDWYSVLTRLHLQDKYQFFLDQTNKTYSLEHGRYPDWEARNAIHGPFAEKSKEYEVNPKLEYLWIESP
jgi:hypothetical protein